MSALALEITQIAHKLVYFNWQPDTPALWAKIDSQQLFLFTATELLKTYVISTAAKGLGSQQNSHKTPPGCHRIIEKIGASSPAGTIFKGRLDTGKNIYSDVTDPHEDLITSRILRLEGLEEGINRGVGLDSFARMIYIHGTNQETFLGQPCSHGCIRMANADIIELFDLVSDGRQGTLLWIG